MLHIVGEQKLRLATFVCSVQPPRPTWSHIQGKVGRSNIYITTPAERLAPTRPITHHGFLSGACMTDMGDWRL